MSSDIRKQQVFPMSSSSIQLFKEDIDTKSLSIDLFESFKNFDLSLMTLVIRSPFIKQADVLQGFYFFEDHFDKATLERHFNFYEPLTVHESSLSPCIHAILASHLGKKEIAYNFYLQTSRLDLDDYNLKIGVFKEISLQEILEK